jgi:type I restriction enzyme, S subunit
MKTRAFDQTEEVADALPQPSELPEGWEVSRMGLIADVIGGGTPKTSEPDNFSENGHPWITPADLSDFESVHIKRGRRGLTDKGLRSSSATMMPSGAVLMSSRAPIGYVAVAANPLSTNQGFKSFVCHPGVVPEYCYHWLKFIKPHLEKMGSGTTFLEISGGRAREIPVIVAPTAEQKRVVAKVQDLMTRQKAAREHLSRASMILKRLRQAVLAAACSGRLTEDWRITHSKEVQRATNGESARKGGGPLEKLGRSQNQGLYELPTSWRWATLAEACERITVGHVGPMAKEYLASGVPFLRSQNVREFRFDLIGLKFISPSFHQTLAKSALRPGDVAVVRSGNAGVACVIPEDLPVANCADLVIIRPSAVLDPQFVCIFINSSWGRSHVDEVKVGIAQSHFNIGEARQTLFPMPPLHEQREIVRRVEALFKLADAIEGRVAVTTKGAERLGQAILAKAFRGELVPTEAEVARREGREYEPASALLERIRVRHEAGGAAAGRPKRQPNDRRNALGHFQK